jgi:hypothetical protein
MMTLICSRGVYSFSRKINPKRARAQRLAPNTTKKTISSRALLVAPLISLRRCDALIQKRATRAIEVRSHFRAGQIGASVFA